MASGTDWTFEGTWPFEPRGFRVIVPDHLGFGRSEKPDDLWLADFPKARVLRLPDAGHYLQEDAHEQIVPALLEFLG